MFSIASFVSNLEWMLCQKKDHKYIFFFFKKKKTYLCSFFWQDKYVKANLEIGLIFISLLKYMKNTTALFYLM